MSISYFTPGSLMRPNRFLLWVDGIWRCQELRPPWEQGMRNRDRDRSGKFRKVYIRWRGWYSDTYLQGCFRKGAGKEAQGEWSCCAGRGINVAPTVQAGESL